MKYLNLPTIIKLFVFTFNCYLIVFGRRRMMEGDIGRSAGKLRNAWQNIRCLAYKALHEYGTNIRDITQNETIFYTFHNLIHPPL